MLLVLYNFKLKGLMGGIILLCDCLLIFCGNFSRFMWIVLVLCSMKLILLIMVFEEKLVVVDLYFENVI